MLCMQDPQIPNCRDLAIAHDALTLFGLEIRRRPPCNGSNPSRRFWVGPAAMSFRRRVCRAIHGHIQTATNWCMNLPVLMAGANGRRPRTA